MNFRNALPFLFSLAALTALTPRALAGGDGPMTQGVIEYSVDADALDPQLAPFFKDMALTFYFSGNNVRVESRMGAMGTTTVISKDGKTVMLMDMMGNKIAMDETPEQPDADISVSYTDATKTILGYECRKAIVTAAGTEMTYWVTDRIQMPHVESNMMVAELDGHPLEMELNLGMATVTMTATKVEASKVSADRFDTTIPDGYQKMNADELMQMMGGMGQ